jgi:probable phosphoglycerate mutase
MTLLYLVRHGETDWNRARRIQGLTDIRLNETGREQARATGRLLARRSWNAIASSPLSRAAETAQIIAAELSLPEPALLDSLIERNYGDAEGLTDEELSERYGSMVPVIGRESREAVVRRTVPALIQLAEQHSDGSVVVVSHGGVIRSVLMAIRPGAGPHHTEHIPNGSVHTVRYSNGALELLAFDDPIDEASTAVGTDDFPVQNAVERREA